MDIDNVKKFHNAYITGNVDELDRLWNNVAPKLLIKFYAAKYMEDGTNYSLDSIKNNMIWLSSPKCFNVPLDCVFNFDYNTEAEEEALKAFSIITNEEIKERIIESDTGRLILNQMKSRFQNDMSIIDAKVEDSTYVTCFSETNNIQDLSMWAHYANDHKGFCAEYDFKDINSVCEFGCIPVLYSNLYYQYKVGRNDGVERILGRIYTKAESWATEKEWRVVEMGKKKGLSGYRKNCELPLRIYIGCRASEKLISDLKQLCFDKKIELFKMELTPGSYNLKYRLMEP